MREARLMEPSGGWVSLFSRVMFWILIETNHKTKTLKQTPVPQSLTRNTSYRNKASHSAFFRTHTMICKRMMFKMQMRMIAYMQATLIFTSWGCGASLVYGMPSR